MPVAMGTRHAGHRGEDGSDPSWRDRNGATGKSRLAASPSNINHEHGAAGWLGLALAKPVMSTR